MRKLVFLFTYLLLAAPCQARIITVDDDGIADFNSIQPAIDSANDGDTIIVQPGLYGEDINFLGKNITLTSTNPANPNIVSGTIIGDVWPNESIITFKGTENPSCTLSGFRIRGFIAGNGDSTDDGERQNTHATISYCQFQNNGGIIGTVIGNCDGLITNCLIAENQNKGLLTVVSPGSIVECYGIIKNCTIVGNEGNGINLGSGGSVIIENCIIYSGIELCGMSPHGDFRIDVIYTNLQDGLDGIFSYCPENTTINWGSGNIDADPCFVRVGYLEYDEPNWIFFEGDYHLQSEAGRWDPNINSWVTDANTSLCIDAGNPGCPTGSEPLPNGNRINMGAYAGTSTASKSPANWRSIADLTNDWVVDFNDLAVFVDYWLDNGECLPSDLNRNQYVDFADFAIFSDDWLW